MQTHLLCFLFFVILFPPANQAQPVKSSQFKFLMQQLNESIVQTEKIATAIHDLSDDVKQKLKLSTFSIVFNRVVEKCYSKDCTQAKNLTDSLQMFIHQSNILDCYFIVSLLTAKQLESIGKIDEKVKTLPIFFLGKIKQANQSQFILSNLKLIEQPNHHLILSSSIPQFPVPSDNTTSDFHKEFYEDIYSYAKSQGHDFSIFDELLIAGLEQPLESFVKVEQEERIELYYKLLCEQPEVRFPIPNETKFWIFVTTLMVVLFLVDVFGLPKWIKNRLIKIKNSQNIGLKTETDKPESIYQLSERGEGLKGN